MEEIIIKLSKELSKNNIYHKIERNFIKTRKTKVKIPKPNTDIIYLLGVIMGDGSLCKSKRKRGGYHYIFRIYSGDKEYLKYLNTLFNKYFLILGKIIKDERKENAYTLAIKNASVFFYFVRLGSEIGKKKEGNIPMIAQKNNENLLNYLAGLVDTDGSIYRKRIHLKQKSHILLKKINKLSNKLKLNCSVPKVNYTNNIPYYYIRFDNNLPLRLKQKSFKSQNIRIIRPV